MMERRKPLVADIKRNSLDDGPGIRSVVFFKGCPLRCVWCHNPECIRAEPEIMFRPESCIGCKSCHEVCLEDAIATGGSGAIDRHKCTLCGDCVAECPSGALSIIGRYYSPDELVDALARDRAFYDNSGGGVTLSGGEPTLMMEYTAEVARKLKGRGVNVLIETCADFSWPRFAKELLPNVDGVYVDMKLESDELHARFTGRGNARIKKNIERLIAEDSIHVQVRVPLIPDATATTENLEALARWLGERGLKRISLLPYNPLWAAKARGLGRAPEYERDTWMSEEMRTAAKQAFASFAIERDF